MIINFYYVCPTCGQSEVSLDSKKQECCIYCNTPVAESTDSDKE